LASRSGSGKQTKIAVVGIGLIGARHLQLVHECSRSSAAAVVDPAASARNQATKNGINWYPGIDALLSNNRPDGVIIATPNQMHVDNALQCVRAGIPVLVEKPIADTCKSAELLVAEAERLDVPILIGHHRRHNPIIKAARQQLQEGAIGKLVAVHASCWLYKPDDYFQVEWRTRRGAGPVFINLIHDIDLLRHLIGEIKSVHAVESNTTRKHKVEDSAAIVLTFESGAIGTVTVSDTIVSPWSWELTAAENPAYPATEQTCYQIGGTCGSLEIPTGRLWYQNEACSWWKPILHKTTGVEAADPLMLQLEHFCDVINGAVAPLVSGREGLKSLGVIEAIKQSAETGKTVHLSA
jgi:predicted dehydrogenase